MTAFTGIQTSIFLRNGIIPSDSAIFHQGQAAIALIRAKKRIFAPTRASNATPGASERGAKSLNKGLRGLRIPELGLDIQQVAVISLRGLVCKRGLGNLEFPM
jgi:hypothetical protein